MSEKLCLQWNDFQENVKSAFGNLREDNDFAYVTLACEDGQQVEAHKVILASSSPFFQKLLGRNKHPHPLIYMRGMKSEDLLAIVDFLYRGEANVFQENLDSFLAIAEELPLANVKIPKTAVQRQAPNRNIHDLGENRTLAIPGNNSGDFEELDEKIKSMMEKSENRVGHQKASVCKVCGKEGFFTSIKNHIERFHLEGFIVSCNQCEKTYNSRSSLKRHYEIHSFQS